MEGIEQTRRGESGVLTWSGLLVDNLVDLPGRLEAILQVNTTYTREWHRHTARTG